jgi:hypothetical protein
LLQLINQTPFAPAMFLFPNEDGIDTLYVAVKASFDLSSTTPKIAEQQRGIVLTDEYWGEPGKSSLRYATEAHLMKQGTDVAVVGDALAPKGKRVTQMDISLTVSDRTKSIRVWGDRQWKKTRPGNPEPFERMPIVYERAFGGMQIIEKSNDTVEVHAEPFNPVGRGFRGKRPADEIEQEPVPNLEDKEHPFSSINAKTTPVGFGFVAPSWAPRMHFAGTYDKQWQKSRAPYLPTDFDSRFFNSAFSGWVFEEGLPIAAPVCIENMSSRGVLEFEVPSLMPHIEVILEGKTETPSLHLETLLIEPNDERCYLTWRASVACDKKALAVSEVRIKG